MRDLLLHNFFVFVTRKFRHLVRQDLQQTAHMQAQHQTNTLGAAHSCINDESAENLQDEDYLVVGANLLVQGAKVTRTR